jgi:putative membrane protein
MQRMKHLFTVGALAAALLFSACEKDDDDDNVSAQDRSFVRQMALSNRTEIALGSLAAAKATNDSVRMYAQMMVMEHTTADSTLGLLAGSLGISVPPDSLAAASEALRTAMMGLTGRDFDSAYIGSQIPGHQTALTIAQTETNAGTNAQLRSFAESMTPKIQQHLVLADTIANRFK